MATNAYPSEHRVSFDPASPARWFGYYITTSGDSCSVHCFGSPEAREEFAAEVAALLPAGSDAYDRNIFSAIVAAALAADSDADREWWSQVLAEKFPDVEWETLQEIHERHSL